MAIIDLDTLLEKLQPVLDSEEYVFCTVNNDLTNYLSLNPLATFMEAEGLTLVLTKVQAQSLGFCIDSTFKRITLSVYSSLEAVGLTAVVASALAKEGISANVIAAYHHDHVFVPLDKANQAIQILARLSDFQ
ncbi:transporter [Thiopseudomonas alkaliphila]|uniref:ACT domain-containing protein n=1 Tax=Thiopseudomonas alkaliphila TaxID=1697053 RepID=UPI00069F41EC|nr:ACT domain-containing protein [Thiopseudomonas alkaliphila]AKX44938.1 transporter [Thiopseudomonas alkaliphila]